MSTMTLLRRPTIVPDHTLPWCMYMYRHSVPPGAEQEGKKDRTQARN